MLLSRAGRYNEMTIAFLVRACNDVVPTAGTDLPYEKGDASSRKERKVLARRPIGRSACTPR